jgi:8-oxo-dGTP pyrophosphatase MutT (NUDIX family)
MGHPFDWLRRGLWRDHAWQLVYRIGFPLARLWWRFRQLPHQGALVAVYVDDAMLLVRSSYRAEWNFPGGGVRPGEAPEAAARRELAEEIGLTAPALVHAGSIAGRWDGRPDRVHFFELRLKQAPELRLDNREIVGARLVAPADLATLSLTGPVAAYLGRRCKTGHEPAR